MEEPTFDKDGYPTAETLSTIENWPAERGFRDLTFFVGEAWRYARFPYTEGYFVVQEDLEHIAVIMITGGWSGNESLIGALERNLLFRSFWTLSTSGGYHLYTFPKGAAIWEGTLQRPS